MMWFSERELGHAMLDVARFGRPLSGDSQTKFFFKEMKQQILFRRHFGVDVPGKPTGNSRVLVFPLVTSRASTTASRQVPQVFLLED